jgi:hypothetical protein
MKTLYIKSSVLTGCFGLAAILAFALPVTVTAAPGGTDITHYMVSTAMTNNGVEPGSAGMVSASQKTQGHADNETLNINLSGLSTNQNYELVAIYDTDTNVVDVGSFSTDSSGQAQFNYTRLGHGHGGGKKSTPLPDGIDPVSLIRELDIVNTNLQVVLSADLTAPDRLQYLIKRNLSNGGVSGSLMIQANPQNTHFRLSATGLTPNADYLLAFNDEVVQTNTASANGRLDIHSLVETPPIILDVRTVELWDTSTNLVLEAGIP